MTISTQLGREGFPRWKDEIRLHYVMAMKEKIDKSSSLVFDGLILSWIR
jgi:hypothetical protein